MWGFTEGEVWGGGGIFFPFLNSESYTCGWPKRWIHIHVHVPLKSHIQSFPQTFTNMNKWKRTANDKREKKEKFMK